jgi:hypothetical protein
VKLIARVFPFGSESTRLLLPRLSPRAVAAVKSSRYPIAIGDGLLGEILQAGDATGDAKGFGIAGEAIFTPAELTLVTHYELVCRALVRESAADFAANDAVRARTPLVDAGGEAPIRLMADLSLDRIPLKPTMVGAIGDWTQEYIAGAAVTKTFRDARLTGVSYRPVARTASGTAHDGFVQLFSDAIMAPAAIDESVERLVSRVPEEHGRLRHLGNLAYPAAALRDRPDFNRTAEPWAGWHGWPSWVVTARVEQVFRAGKLRGWHFRPVLATESDLYADYAASWRTLRDIVRGTAKSRFEGGRW